MSEDFDLGETDNTEANDFPPAERQISTQAYDLSIRTLAEQWDDKTLTIPDFQREYVWDNAKASRLIESLLLNIPIPVLFFAETPDAQYQIVDGHQRVFTIVRYLENQFPLTGLKIQEEFKGLRFHQLPEREQRFLRTRVMRAIIIGVDSSPAMKFEVFERLNTGGLALNAQEIRHGLNSGQFMTLLAELESEKAFRYCLNVARPRKRMVDRELILRFFALRDRLPEYRTPLARFLNEYTEDHREPGVGWIEDHRQVFLSTMQSIYNVLGGAAFRAIDEDGKPTERAINRAVFEAESLIFSIADADKVGDHAVGLRREIGKLFKNATFVDYVRSATGDRTRTYGRIAEVARAFQRAGVDVPLEALGEVAYPTRAR